MAVTSTDNAGNSNATTKEFRVRATSESLINNVDRAWSLGLISKEDVYEGLDDKLQAASKSHDRGKHRTEWNQLGAFINLLQAQSGKAIDEEIAARLEAFARDLIDSGG